jgi:very-short-patch-repair endonuclease
MAGKTHSETAKQNISQKRKEKFANGEYNFISSEKWSTTQKQVWNRAGHKEKMKEAREISGWREKLSSAHKGEKNYYYGKKRPEHSKLMKSPEMMEKIFAKRSMTDIEQLVALMLDQVNIPYHAQFFIVHDAETYAYDFKLKDLPFLIEVDGDYWHGGPSTTNHVPFVNEIQTKDKLKNEIAQQHGYTVLRFWGSDVKERPFWVIQQLLSHIQPQ